MIPAIEIEITADPKAAERGFARIAKAQKGLEAATTAYQTKLQELERAERSGLVTKEGTARAIAELEREYQGAAAAASSYVGATTNIVRANGAVTASNARMGKSMQVASQHTTNLMFQFQDIAMMLSAGQNPLMLAMQQGTQVSGVFHQMKASGMSAFQGIKAGLAALVSPMSLLTVGVIAGGAALVQFGVSALTSAENTDRLTESMAALGDEIEQRSAEITRIKNNLDSVSQARVFQELTRLQSERATLAAEISRMEQDIASKLSAQYDYKQQQLAALDQQIASVQSLLSQYDEQTEVLSQSNRTAQILSDTLAAIDMSGAIAQANVFLGAMQGAALAAAAAANAAYANFERNLDPFGGAGDFQYGVADTFRPSTFPSGRGGGARSSGGGGGSSRLDALRSELEAVQEIFKTEHELEVEKYALQQETLQQALEQRLITQEEYNQLMQQSQAKHNEAMAQLDQARRDAAMSGMAGMFGDLAGLMGSENKKLFKIGQAAAIAESVVKGYQAAVSAWEKGMKIGGPGLAAAFTAASLARTGLLISKIAGASPSGGGGGAASAGGAVTSGASGGGNRPTQNVMIDLVGATPTQAEQFQRFADMLTEMDRMGYRPNVFVRGT